MKQKIIRNLFLSIDYHREKSVSGIFLGKHVITLIGTLPIVLVWKDGSKEVSKIKVGVPITLGDPELRNALGARAVDARVGKKYAAEIMTMVEKLKAVIEKAMDLETFAGKPMKSLSIINFSDGPKKDNNQSQIITK
jgi:hypothetical protein